MHIPYACKGSMHTPLGSNCSMQSVATYNHSIYVCKWQLGSWENWVIKGKVHIKQQRDVNRFMFSNYIIILRHQLYKYAKKQCFCSLMRGKTIIHLGLEFACIVLKYNIQ